MDEVEKTVGKLTSDNWNTWKTRMQAFLTIKGHWGDTQNDEDLGRSAVTLAYIRLGVSDYYLSVLDTVTTARNGWRALTGLFNTNNSATRMQLRRELANLRMRADENVEGFLVRANQIRQRLTAAGVTPTEEELVQPVLAGLPAEFDVVVSIMETSTDNLTLQVLRTRLLLAEQRIRRTPSRIPGTESALYTSPANSHPHQSRYNRTDSSAYDPNHRGYNQQGNDSGRRSQRPYNPNFVNGVQQQPDYENGCGECGRIGHRANDCLCKQENAHKRRQTWQPPRWYTKQVYWPPAAQSNNRPPATAYAAEESSASGASDDNLALAVTGSIDTADTRWILDSGASKHITSSADGMINVRDLTTSDCKVTFANGQHQPVTAMGDLRISGNGVIKPFTLTDVLVVPGATANLLSIPAAVARGATFTFQHDIAHIHLRDAMIATARRGTDGVYSLNGENNVSYATALTSSAKLWHQRLGHIGNRGLQQMIQQDMVNGLDLSLHQARDFTDKVCEPCMAAKQTRTAFPTSTTTTSRPLELLHMDVMGPLPMPSLSGKLYLATFLDDYSGLSMVTPLAHKSDVPAAVKDTIKYLSRQSGCQLKAVCTDNGGEYVNHELAQFFQDHGIQHQTTIPYNPELNQTLLESVVGCAGQQELYRSRAHAQFSSDAFLQVSDD